MPVGRLPIRWSAPRVFRFAGIHLYMRLRASMPLLRAAMMRSRAGRSLWMHSMVPMAAKSTNISPSSCTSASAARTAALAMTPHAAPAPNADFRKLRAGARSRRNKQTSKGAAQVLERPSANARAKARPSTQKPHTARLNFDAFDPRDVPTMGEKRLSGASSTRASRCFGAPSVPLNGVPTPDTPVPDAT